MWRSIRKVVITLSVAEAISCSLSLQRTFNRFNNSSKDVQSQIVNGNKHENRNHQHQRGMNLNFQEIKINREWNERNENRLNDCLRGRMSVEERDINTRVTSCRLFSNTTCGCFTGCWLNCVTSYEHVWSASLMFSSQFSVQFIYPLPLYLSPD